MNKDELDTIATVSKEIIKPVYDDGLKPAVSETGKALSTVVGVVNMALVPISLMVHGFKQIEDNLKSKLTEKLATTNPDEIKEPPLNIVGPLLEKYKYNYDNEILSDMFVNLLANSMDLKRSSEAHPSFVDIISQLSSDEARLLRNVASSQVCPKLDIAVETSESAGYDLIRRNLLQPKNLIGIQYPNLVPSYLDNLQRLNLINYTSGAMQEKYADKTLYDELKNDSFVKTLEAGLNIEKQKIKLFEGHIRITDFGRIFFNSVTR